MSHAIRVAVAAALVAGTVVAGSSTPASAAPVWNPNGSVHPGVQTITAGGQCTANFVFYDSSNNIYIGQSAHCASKGTATQTTCTTPSEPLGTKVSIGGASRQGTLVYSSWIAMQNSNPPEPSNSQACLYNDFAIVKLDPADYGRVNPTVPFWGGPNAINTLGQGIAYDVFSYGNSGLRLGLTPLSPKQGLTSNSTGPSSWSIRMYTASPGVPGDSGSAILDKNGNAFATLSTLSVDGSNGGAAVRLALDYLRANSSYTTLQLATGLTPFSPLP